MHIHIIKNIDLDSLKEEINKEINNLNSCPAADRNYTVIKDVKLSHDGKYHIATLIYDQVF